MVCPVQMKKAYVCKGNVGDLQHAALPDLISAHLLADPLSPEVAALMQSCDPSLVVPALSSSSRTKQLVNAHACVFAAAGTGSEGAIYPRLLNPSPQGVKSRLTR